MEPFDYTEEEDQPDAMQELPQIDPANIPPSSPEEVLAQSYSLDPKVSEARQLRDKQIADATVNQGITELATALASQGRVKPSTAVFDAIKKNAQQHAEEAGKDVSLRQKTISDYIKGQAAQKKAEEAKARQGVLDKRYETSNARSEAMLGLRQREVEAKEKEAGLKNTDIKRLPEEQQHEIIKLAESNANKESIANQIDSVLGGWDKLSNDQKVLQGRQLIKVLNSTQGQDAVGNQEREALGAKLEFALGNFTNSNPIQFGRDLEGFKEQAANTAKFVRQGAKENQKIIDSRYAKVGVNRPTEPPNLSPEDQKAIDWANTHSNDPRAAAIKKRLGM